MVAKLILILGDQLSFDLSAFKNAEKSRDTIVMAEVSAEAKYVSHHPKKIILILSAMRKFADALRAQGWRVAYTKLDDPQNTGSIAGELIRRAAEFGVDSVEYTEPGEWRLIQELMDVPLTMHCHEDTRFFASHKEFEDWAKDRKTLRMEYFYREMRRKTELLMVGGAPFGGQWNFDHDNRKAPPKQVSFPGPMQFKIDPTTREVIDLVKARFADHFGDPEPFWFATDHAEAQKAFKYFIDYALPQFGDYQDAMLDDNAFLYHSLIALYLNIGLLSPKDVCEAAQEAYLDEHAPLNSVEGFIRQILGWREYVRGIYFLKGSNYTSSNYLGATRKLPAFFWGAPTKMNCLSHVIAQTQEEGYAHHIQRLMITGNFALLAGIDPHQVHEWYLSVYVDAFEWVEAPNTIGMSQFADGGVIASKPYVSSDAYINRMSNYCKSCDYGPKRKDNPEICPFKSLYWDFLNRHRDKFAKNPRMAQMYRTWDRMSDEKKAELAHSAQLALAKLEQNAL
jgi:deoxyribodipyrimidine photolyase-related protein